MQSLLDSPPACLAFSNRDTTTFQSPTPHSGPALLLAHWRTSICPQHPRSERRGQNNVHQATAFLSPESSGPCATTQFLQHLVQHLVGSWGAGPFPFIPQRPVTSPSLANSDLLNQTFSGFSASQPTGTSSLPPLSSPPFLHWSRPVTAHR